MFLETWRHSFIDPEMLAGHSSFWVQWRLLCWWILYYHLYLWPQIVVCTSRAVSWDCFVTHTRETHVSVWVVSSSWVEWESSPRAILLDLVSSSVSVSFTCSVQADESLYSIHTWLRWPLSWEGFTNFWTVPPTPCPVYYHPDCVHINHQLFLLQTCLLVEINYYRKDNMFFLLLSLPPLNLVSFCPCFSTWLLQTVHQ